jgi:serine/threonine protein kinase
MHNSGHGSSSAAQSSSCKYQHLWPTNFVQQLQQGLVLKDALVSYDELQLCERIGDGSAGEVFRAQWRGSVVAVKIVKVQQFAEMTAADKAAFREEAYLMSKLRYCNT